MELEVRNEKHLMCISWMLNVQNDEYKKLGNLFHVYGSVHHNYEITNICSYMQSILFHC